MGSQKTCSDTRKRWPRSWFPAGGKALRWSAATSRNRRRGIVLPIGSRPRGSRSDPQAAATSRRRSRTAVFAAAFAFSTSASIAAGVNRPSGLIQTATGESARRRCICQDRRRFVWRRAVRPCGERGDERCSASRTRVVCALEAAAGSSRVGHTVNRVAPA
jgi:hypothetical protein